MKTIALVLCVLGFPVVCVAQQPAPASQISCKPPRVLEPTTADKAFFDEHFAEANSLYAAQLAAAPTENNYAGLVATLIELNRNDEALAQANKAVAAFPNSAAALVLVGDAQLRASHIDVALTTYGAARKLDFCNARAHFGIARILQFMSFNAAAQTELITAHKLAPTDAEISESLFATLPAPQQAEGLRNLLASNPTMPAARHKQLVDELWLQQSGASCTIQSPIKTAKVPLYPVILPGNRTRDFDIRLQINGKSTHLELDSTAPGIVLSRSEATRLGITSAEGGSGSYGIASSVVFASNLHFSQCPVRIVPDAALAGEASIIGTTFFREYLQHISWLDRNLTLTAYESNPAGPVDRTIPATEKSWSMVYIDKGRILIPAAVNKKPVPPVLLDTGQSGEIILSPAVAASLYPVHDENRPIHGVSGEFVRIYGTYGGAHQDFPDLFNPEGKIIPIYHSLKNVALTFAANNHVVQGSDSFDLTPLSHVLGIETGGLVPFLILREYDINIDYRNGLVLLKWDEMFGTRQEGLR